MIGWAALAELLGEPASRGLQPLATEQWWSSREQTEETEYAVWDCNGCLDAVKDASRVLDALEEEASLETTGALRGTVARFFAVACCMAQRNGGDIDAWNVTNACARHVSGVCER